VTKSQLTGRWLSDRCNKMLSHNILDRLEESRRRAILGALKPI